MHKRLKNFENLNGTRTHEGGISDIEKERERDGVRKNERERWRDIGTDCQYERDTERVEREEKASSY